MAAAAFAALLVSAPASATADADRLAAYLRARAAQADDRLVLAAQGYGAALDASGGDATVAARAWSAAVPAGDMALADRAAAVLARNDALPIEAPLLAVGAAAHAHDLAAANRAIETLAAGQLRIVVPSLRAWAALEAGGDPLQPLAASQSDVVARRFGEETRALVLIAAGRPDEGLAALRARLGNDQASIDLRIAAARLLLGQGKKEAARALLVGDRPAIAALRSALDQPAKGTLAFGVATLFTRIASDLALGDPNPIGYALLQGALRADPADDRARLLLAGALTKDGANDRALAVLGEIAPASIYAGDAAAGRIVVLSAAGRDREALSAAETLADAKDADTTDVARLAALYSRVGRANDAATLYRQLIDRAGGRAAWDDWLQYGAALDAAGDWPGARAALERSLALAPEEPLTLNYLGYGLLTHGERGGGAEAMLEKAARLKPDDAAIADSLGWALFLRGQTARALPLIERAAAGEPANPEITEHLGDAYWRVGRRYEARYAWSAAEAMADPTAALRLAGKIANGL